MDKTDFVIIGSGIAGVRAAIELASRGETVVLTKSRPDESNTEYAQGGIAVAMSDEDEIGLHYEDTIRAGDGLCSESAVRVLVEEGPARIQELIDWGTEFDREGVKLAFTREAAHSRKRILHAQGDSTGREINRTLLRKVQSLGNVSLRPYSFALNLLIGNNGCEGISYLEEKTGAVREIGSRAVLLATGGAGVLYGETTNPDIATGDGYSLAFRAGAALADMEFIQFHPTALRLTGAPSFLLTEALRGEGGKLKNANGEMFMSHYHALGDLAPRDVVSRGIFFEAEKTKEAIFLDLTHLDPDFVRRRFPRIHGTCLQFGLDISRQPIPVFPAAHYAMGGVYTDNWGRTTIPGLFAAGEAACNGVHGANRLASNSLLEGLVYGARAGQAMAGEASQDFELERGTILHIEGWEYQETEESTPDRKQLVRRLMSDQVGIVRSAESLEAATRQLKEVPFVVKKNKAEQETNNLLLNARLVSALARLRQESRGAHYRTDYPVRDDAHWRKRLRVHLEAATENLVFDALPVEVNETQEGRPLQSTTAESL